MVRLPAHTGAALSLIGVLLVAATATAGQTPAPSPDRQTTEQTSRGGLGIDVLATLNAPPPPRPPAILARDSAGRVTARAVRLATRLRIDGQLEEAVYAATPPMSGFIQNDPAEGAPASETTEMWVFFDDDNVYVSARCWESRPDRVLVNEMRRDSGNIGQYDNLAWSFDTFFDRRNGTLWEVNPLGGRIDGQTSNEGRTNLDWNPVWNVKVGEFDGGWTVEAAIPFKSLRYRPGPSQLWGFNARRRNLWKSEVSYLTPIPAALGPRGLRPSLLAPLVGIEAPPGSRNLEVKPYAISELSTAPGLTPPVANDWTGDIGLDVKYGVTQNLTADFTYNTDFAQVEADQLQVNLTRFSLFFPEKREFFLENQSTFDFGGSGSGGDTPILFYSRRVGLQGGREVPIQAGGRMTGRIGGFDLGLLHIRTDDEPVSGAQPTGFSVVRLKRDVLGQSTVGLIATGRSVSVTGSGTNTAYGVDGAFAFLENQLAIDTYWAQTRTEGVSGPKTSYRANLDYDGDRYGVRAERLVIGSGFNPEVGFVRRPDMRKSAGLFRFSPRLRTVESIRKLSWTGSIDYIESGAGILETREGDGEFGIEFENGDELTAGYLRSYELLPQPFEIASGVILPVSGYDFGSVRAGYNLGQQRLVSARVLVEHGTFYNGHRTALTVSRGRLKLTPQLAIEPSYTANWVDLAEGAFTSHLLGSRVIYTMTPEMFTSALLQYDSASNTVSANIRLRWEYQPGSELFVVYNEQRDTLARRFPEIQNRAFIIKINRLFRL